MGGQVVVETSAAALASAIPSPDDGQPAVIRINGSNQDSYDIPLVYNVSMTQWVGCNEYDIVRSTNELAAQPQSSPGLTTKQVLASNSNVTVAGGDVLSNSVALRHVDLATTAGLSLQYRHHGYLMASGETTSQNMNVGCVFFNAAVGDAYDTTHADAVAETGYLNGGVAWTGSGAPPYAWAEAGWATLLAPGGGSMGTLSKSVLYAEAWGYADAGATAAPGVAAYCCWVRWVI